MLHKISLILILGIMASCSSIMSSATNSMATNLSFAIINQNDPATVRDGAPAYLLLIDSLIEGNPQDASRLLTGAKLNSTYAGVFVQDKERAKLMAAKALAYAKRALCVHNEALCLAYDKPYEEFQPVLEQSTIDDIPYLHGLGSSWSTWVTTSNSNWSSIANLPKIKSMMQRIVALQEDYDHGSAHLYLGVMDSQLPPNLGGKPEQARYHFEQAIKLSDGKSLMVKVLFAQHYARLMYKRELHDQLLKEVLASEADVPGFTLMNVLAKKQARVLLDSADDYF